MSIYTLSIDPASRLCGVSLFEDLKYINSILLKSELKTWSERVAEMRKDLREFVITNLPKGQQITRAIMELVPKIVEPSIQMAGGGLLSDSIYNLDLTRKFLISPSTWQAYARRNGSPDKYPKGVKALKQINFPVEKYKITSDDVADSIMIFLAWAEKNVK